MTPEQVEDIAIKAAVAAARDAAEISVAEAARKAAETVAAIHKSETQTLVAEAVKQTLVQLGIDVSNPLEVQADLQHLRSWRKAGEDLRRKGLATLVTIFVTGLIGLILVGVRAWFEKG